MDIRRKTNHPSGPWEARDDLLVLANPLDLPQSDGMKLFPRAPTRGGDEVVVSHVLWQLEAVCVIDDEPGGIPDPLVRRRAVGTFDPVEPVQTISLDE